MQDEVSPPSDPAVAGVAGGYIGPSPICPDAAGDSEGVDRRRRAKRIIATTMAAMITSATRSQPSDESRLPPDPLPPSRPPPPLLVTVIVTGKEVSVLPRESVTVTSTLYVPVAVGVHDN